VLFAAAHSWACLPRPRFERGEQQHERDTWFNPTRQFVLVFQNGIGNNDIRFGNRRIAFVLKPFSSHDFAVVALILGANPTCESDAEMRPLRKCARCGNAPVAEMRPLQPRTRRQISL